jgi:hypothetical protein
VGGQGEEGAGKGGKGGVVQCQYPRAAQRVLRAVHYWNDAAATIWYPICGMRCWSSCSLVNWRMKRLLLVPRYGITCMYGIATIMVLPYEIPWYTCTYSTRVYVNVPYMVHVCMASWHKSTNAEKHLIYRNQDCTAFLKHDFYI